MQLRILIDNIVARLVALEQREGIEIPQQVFDELASIERIAEEDYSNVCFCDIQTEFNF